MTTEQIIRPGGLLEPEPCPRCKGSGTEEREIGKNQFRCIIHAPCEECGGTGDKREEEQ